MRAYTSMFFVALATLAFELTLSRLLSVITWYHIGFLAISVAMLGMTAGAITVFLGDRFFSQERLTGMLQKACYCFALSVPIALWAICYIPFMTNLTGNDLVGKIVNMVLVTSLVSLPFYFSGIFISAMLTRYPLPVNRLYAADLIVAAMGCVLVLIGLSLLDAPSFALVCSFIAVLGSLLLAKRGTHVVTYMLLVVIALGVGIGNSHTRLISPQFIKGAPVDMDIIETDRWNSFSRISISKEMTFYPMLWGAYFPFIKDQMLPQRVMQIDGGAGTTMRRFHSNDDIDHLKYDVTNIAYFLRSPNEQPEKSTQQKAAIIGVGGAKDIQSAILFGYDDIVGIEVNPIFIDLLQNEYLDFAGVGDNDKVHFEVDEARSYLSHSDEKYDIMQMSLIDTWAATSAGAFSLSENALYTVEGWLTFTERLTDDGIFTVSRWYNSRTLGETGRIMSLAIATMLEMGVENPAAHIALVTNGSVATLIMSMSPLTEVDLSRLRKASAELKHEIRIIPGETVEHSMLAKILSARSLSQLESRVSQAKFNLSPPTDENPYFFNMLRLENLGSALKTQSVGGGVIDGNLTATITLITLIGILGFLTLMAIIVPLLLYYSREKKTVPFSSALFFCLIGAGFMSLEIAFLQRLTVFLGHPIYALSVLLFSFIASTGVGSLLSEKLCIDNSRKSTVLSICTVTMILVIYTGMNHFIGILIVYPMWVKCLAAIVMIWPIGLLLGCYFPTGMSLATRNSETATPWYWALNGVFGVLFSALSVFISIYMGIFVNVYIAATCYALTAWCLFKMQQPHIDQR
jgi:spermidine synthase